MIDCQLKPNKINNIRVLDAFSKIPREGFLPPALASVAYLDEDILLPSGRYCIEPMVLARMVQALDAVSGERALVVGAGVGYGAAVLAALELRVVALESNPDLVDSARKSLIEVGCKDVTVVAGALNAGLPEYGPYDIILIEGAVRSIPPALIEQLAEGGRLVTVVKSDGVGVATRHLKHQGSVSAKNLFDAAIPELPGFATPVKFVF